jgi:Na/Pi-cotransporter
MTALLFRLFGGIGLFLLGMVLLTDGLKAFAGEALRRALMRFTGTPVKAFGSGALVTAMVQSSSATTVTVIGFVSAGLLTFPQAVGVVMGASLGTTGTGWIVAVLGLKISVGFYALPLVGIGAFLRLLARGRWKSFGTALAGFGLIFIGIETLQQAMQGIAGVFNFAKLPASGFLGHFLAMLIGMVLTLILQSSSAAVATTLTQHLDDTLLHAPAVALEATRRAWRETACQLFAAIQGAIGAQADDADEARRARIHEALVRTQEFFARIPPVAEDEPLSHVRVAQLHAIDHLTRLEAHLHPEPDVRDVLAQQQVHPLTARVEDILELASAGLHGHAPADWLADVRQQAAALADLRRAARPLVIEQTAGGSSDPAHTLAMLDAMRWLDRVGYHTWRICNYLGSDGKPETSPTDARTNHDE